MKMGREDSAPEAVRGGYTEEEILHIYELGRLSLENGNVLSAEVIMHGLNEVAPDFPAAWRVYWEGQSLRALAAEWETDELNVIREHKAILAFLFKGFSKGKQFQTPKVRPGLRHVALKLKRENNPGYFSELLQKVNVNGEENRR